MITVLLRPIQGPEPVEHRAGAVAEHEVDDDRRRDADRPDEHEGGVGDGLVRAREAELGDLRGGSGGEHEVLRVRRREHDARARRPRRREVVDGAHPLRLRRLRVAARPAAPLLEREQQQDQAEQQLEHVDPGRRLTPVVGAGRARDQEHDHADDREADEPAGHERRAVRPRPWRAEHDDHSDDRHRAQPHADRQGEDLPDRGAHRSYPTPAATAARPSSSIGASSRPNSLSARSTCPLNVRCPNGFGMTLLSAIVAAANLSQFARAAGAGRLRTTVARTDGCAAASVAPVAGGSGREDRSVFSGARAAGRGTQPCPPARCCPC